MRQNTHTTAIVAMMLAAAALLALPPGADGEAAGPASAYAADIGGWMDGGAATTETIQDARLRDTWISAALDGIDDLAVADAWVGRHDTEPMKQSAERHGLEHRSRVTADASKHAATRGETSGPNKGQPTQNVRGHRPSKKGADENWQPEREGEGRHIERTSRYSPANKLTQSRSRPRERVKAHRADRQAMTGDNSNRYGREAGPARYGHGRERRLTC